MPEFSLSSDRLVDVLHGPVVVAFAPTTAKGEPRVAPMGAIFYRRHFHVPMVADSARTRHVRKRPSISLTYYRGNELAVIAHGHADILSQEHPDFGGLDDLHEEHTGASVPEWEEGVYLRLVAKVCCSRSRGRPEHKAR